MNFKCLKCRNCKISKLNRLILCYTTKREREREKNVQKFNKHFRSNRNVSTVMIFVVQTKEYRLNAYYFDKTTKDTFKIMTSKEMCQCELIEWHRKFILIYLLFCVKIFSSREQYWQSSTHFFTIVTATRMIRFNSKLPKQI